MKRKTNFDRYLEEQLKDKDFDERFRKAGQAWAVALQLASLRKKVGLSQKELARRVGTSRGERVVGDSFQERKVSSRVSEMPGVKKRPFGPREGGGAPMFPQ